MADMKSYSQDYQDRFVYDRFFSGKKDGVYVEIGALDGIEISNTLLFQELGWKGMLIEANPEQFEKLEVNRKHPNTVCVYGAAYSANTKLHFRKNNGYTTALSGIEECYHHDHLKRIDKENKEHLCSSELITVPAYKTQDIFDKYGYNHIDYLSIDVEGGELEVLKGIDFERTHVQVITIEDNYGEIEKYKEYLRDFECVARLGQDYVFRNGSIS